MNSRPKKLSRIIGDNLIGFVKNKPVMWVPDVSNDYDQCTENCSFYKSDDCDAVDRSYCAVVCKELGSIFTSPGSLGHWMVPKSLYQVKYFIKRYKEAGSSKLLLPATSYTRLSDVLHNESEGFRFISWL
jgi:hypothetical protein